MYPAGVVSICPNGGLIVITCTTNSSMFLEWTVSSHNRTETQLFSSGTVSGTSYQQIINLTATLTFIKTSNRSAVPLVSILIIDNATSLLNGTNVTCMESARDHRDSTESTPSTIHVVDPLKGIFEFRLAVT